MGGEVIEIKTESAKNAYKKTKTFFGNKKVQNILLIILLLSTIFVGTYIRVQNLDHLKDQTTGEYIPLALDPYYFLRISEKIVEEGGLPEFDPMRKPFDVGYTKEILPQTLVFMHSISNSFGDYSIQYIDVLSPVVFFVFALIVFFFLVYFLTGSKKNAFVSSLFLAVIPSYLYRTMAGFSDHESIGMLAFFSAMLFFAYSLKFLDKEKVMKEYSIKSLLLGIGLGLLSFLTLVSWGGIATFLILIIPLTSLVFWLIKVKNLELNKNNLKNYIMFYGAWIISSLVFGALYGYGIQSILNRFLLGSNSIFTGAILLFMVSDYFLIKHGGSLPFTKNKNLKKYRIFYSALLSLVFGVVLLAILKGNVFSYILDIFNKLLNPFGTERVSLTVAENRQPFLNDWIGSIGKRFFWVFFLGLAFLGFEISKGIKENRHKIWFSLAWVFMITGILFSRISSNSLLNGTNFISRVFYFGSILIFGIYTLWIYMNKKVKIKGTLILLALWMLITLVAARGAIRLFFVITPATTVMVGFAFSRLLDYRKEYKGDLSKLFLTLMAIVVAAILVISLLGFVQASNAQASNTGPSAGTQWQKAMSWIRQNTASESVFVHWWDYGYWVQYLGERATVADGGHFQGSFRDHLIGRYVLTTPFPETALSFMKSNDISYLLIDPTDIGKYSAYSKIGSDTKGIDRFSSIPAMLKNSQQTQETNNSIIYLYQGVSPVDEDIVYTNNEGQQIFLPRDRAVVAGTFIEITNSGEIAQPRGVFFYNNQQITIPLRYLYMERELIDFGTGIESTAYMFPALSTTGANVNIDPQGTIMYLSPKVSKSLVAQLYLMNDPNNLYPTVTLAHSEQDPLVNNINLQGANIEFLYYQGVRGPIKIWEINYPGEILEKEEFLRRSGEFAEFDDLQFTV